MNMLIGVWIGVALTLASTYLAWKRPLERRRDEYKRQRNIWVSRAQEWRELYVKADANCVQAIELAEKLHARPVFDDKVAWRLGDYAERMKGEGFGD